MLFDRPTPISDALRSVQARAVLPLALSSAEISGQIHAQIVDAAFVSARTTYAGYLADVKREIETLVQPGTTTATRTNPLEVRARMRQRLRELGYEPDPDKRGGLQDLSSDRRLDLIIRTQEGMAHGYGHWRSGQDPAILAAYPADEFYRREERDEKRDWLQRWIAARAETAAAGETTASTIAGPPFGALKNDPIWIRLSAFGHPYPPFDFNSGMAVRDIRRDRAVALGVMGPDDKPPRPRADPLARPLLVPASALDAAMQDALLRAFGDRARVIDGQLAVLPPARLVLEHVIDAAARKAQAASAFRWLDAEVAPAVAKALGREGLKPGTRLDIDADHVRHILAQHGDAAQEAARGQVPVGPDDILALAASDALEGHWRAPLPHEIDLAREPGRVVLARRDGSVFGWSYSAKLRRLLLRTIYKKAAPG